MAIQMLSVMPTIITASAAHDSTKLIFPTVLRMSVTTGEVNGKNVSDSHTHTSNAPGAPTSGVN